MKQINKGDLRVWWVPPAQSKLFRVPVKSIDEAKLILNTLTEYNLFLFHTGIQSGYSNAGGLEIFDGDDWTDLYDPDTGDCIDDLLGEESE